MKKLHQTIEETSVIFHRIVKNTGARNTAIADRNILQEFDTRLSSQLLLKAATVRDAATLLKEASAQRVEQTYKYMGVTIGLFAVTLALATSLTALHLGWVIRKRLAPLHLGAKIVAGGNLDFRINSAGSDEFAELAISVNNMTDKLQNKIKAHQQANARLSELNLDFVSFLENTTDFIYFKDRNSRFRFCSQTLADITGHASWLDMIGKHDLDVFPKDMAQIYYEEELPIFREGKALLNRVDPYYDAAGVKGWVSTNKWPLLDHEGRVVGLFGISRDITEFIRVESELRIAATAFEAQEGIAVTDETGQIIRINSAFTRITGYTPEEAVGKNPRILRSGRHDVHFYEAMWESINNTGSWQGEIWNRRKTGEVYPEYLTITGVKNSKGAVTHYVATFNDITLSKAAAEEVKHLAFYDPLTQLPNRRLLIDRLHQAFISSTRSGNVCALLFIDLDNFKTLNDTLGHDVGDLLLQQVGQRLEACVREKDTVARLGGDEFVVILEALGAEPIEAATRTEAVGIKILNSLNLPYLLGKHECRNTPSIGATLFSGHAHPTDELFKQADIAMYQAKNSGRNTLRFFDPHMQDTVNNHAALEADLRKAIENNQFQLYYQVQVDGDYRQLGAEALIRWNHPQRGLLPPSQFIP
ncbi:MAG: diguanylate cyclase, partial [Pseudomonadota bacterium]